MKTVQDLISGGATLDQVNEYTPYWAFARDIRSYLMSEGKWAALVAITPDDALFNASDGLRLAAVEDRPISLNPDTTKGQSHLAMLDSFVLAGLIDDNNRTDIKNAAAAYKPYAAIHAHSYAKMKGLAPDKTITVEGGVAVISTTVDTARHNPSVLEADELTGELIRVATFSGVEKADTYKVRCKNGSFVVDNFFGAIA